MRYMLVNWNSDFCWAPVFARALWNFLRPPSTQTRRNLKTAFPFHTAPKKFENGQLPAILDLCLRKTPAGKSRDYRDVNVFAFFTLKRKVSVFKFLRFEARQVSEKLRFHDGLVWTVTLSYVFKFFRRSVCNFHQEL